MRVLVIGLGSAGTRHARHLVALGHDVLGFDPAVVPNGVTTAPSLDEAIGVSDAVVVASPNAFHAEQAIAAIQRGRPVLVEKPLAVTAEEAQRVVSAAEASGVTCGVAMNLRFHPGIEALRRQLAAGTLGAVRLAQASFGYDLRLWRPGTDYRSGYSARADLGGGIVLDAIHELDYLLWLLGPVTSVTAETGRVSELEIDVEDAAVGALRFASGAFGTIDLNFFEPVYRRGCLLVGTRATARWDWALGSVVIRLGDGSELEERAECDLEETYRAEIEDFVSAAAGGGETRTTAREGLAAVRLAEAIKESASRGVRVSL